MEGRQEGWRVDRKEERQRRRHEGKLVIGRGRIVKITGRLSIRKMSRNVGRVVGRMI
jgi:hypothetical protein